MVAAPEAAVAAPDLSKVTLAEQAGIISGLFFWGAVELDARCIGIMQMRDLALAGGRWSFAPWARIPGWRSG